MAYKYDPISKTLIDADAKFSFEETPNDDNVAAVITIEETDYILKNLSTPTPFKDPKETLFGIGDIISSFSENIYEAYRINRIVNEFENLNIRATQYTGSNDNVYT